MNSVSTQQNGWHSVPATELQQTARAIARMEEKRTADSQLAGGNTQDSFQNFAMNLGIGTDNASTYSTYGFHPITRNRTLLEWMHRGSWLAGVVVDSLADDMTKAGIQITSSMPPKEIQKLELAAIRLSIWKTLGDAKKWGRLYGGALAVVLLDGQEMATPFRMDTVGRDQFKGLLALDRWMVNPSLEDRVEELGPRLGEPKFYDVLAMAPALWGQRIHYSRVIRAEGIELPYWQRIMENLWSISVLERLYDRMVGFDMATSGTIQLAYKAYLRVLKMKNFRQLVAGPPQLLQATSNYLEWMRRWQGIEGITVIDADDEFDAFQPGAYSGLAEVLNQLGQQVAGAAEVPLVRLFGMSPTGFTTGETDLRIYYGGINQKQEKELREPVDLVYRVLARSEGIDLSDDFSFIFKDLWQLPQAEKAEVADRITAAVEHAQSAAIISKKTALKELRQQSRETGIFSNITDEEIEAAEELPPPPPDLFGGMGAPGGEGGMFREQPLGVGEDLPGQLGRGGNGGGEAAERESEGEPLDRPSRPPNLRVVQGGRGGDSTSTALVPGLGFDIMIETPRGAVRPPWQAPLPADYGFLVGTKGADGEPVDVFLGTQHDSSKIWVLDQLWPDSGVFDEHKVFVGYSSRPLVLRDFQRAFSDGLGAARVGNVREMTLQQFNDWLAQGEYKRRRVA